LGLGDIADGLARQAERAGADVGALFFEPVIRLGVTGLARAGKTVFITALVANLLDRGRMPQFAAAASGAIRAAWLEPQPDDTVPRFEYETHLDALTGPAPRWPRSTRQVSQLRLSLKVQPGGLLSGLSGPRTVHLDIVDYPGEWLLDLALLERDYAGWSRDVLERARARGAMAAGFLGLVDAADPDAPYDEAPAQALAARYTAYLQAAREAGLSDCTPGRFLLPGEMEGSPVLTFAPLPPGAGNGPRGSLRREMARRFEAYKAQVVKPFFRAHFARIDRQVVLVDALGAIHAGPVAVEEMRRAMAGILAAFRPGRTSWLAGLLGRRRVDRILFAATKADHLHHSEHAKLTAIVEAALAEAKRRADFAGAETAAMSIAALRATVEDTVTHEGRTLDCVRGRRLDTGAEAAFHAGTLPADPAAILAPARAGAAAWPGAGYGAVAFAPAPLTLRPGEGPPHIRLDRAAEFLLGDKLT